MLAVGAGGSAARPNGNYSGFLTPPPPPAAAAAKPLGEG
jgi:hypothetical protein